MASSVIPHRDIVCVNYTGYSATIAANNDVTKTDIDFSSVVPDGYTPIEFMCGATGSGAVYCYNCLLRSDGKGQVQLRNTYSYAVSVTPQFRVLCAKL